MQNLLNFASLRTGYFVTRVSTTDGDSGNPLIFQKNGKAVCLMGVSSFTITDCDNGGTMSVFTPTYEFLMWIKSQRRLLSSNDDQPLDDVDDQR